jgi:hypothetical protein
VLQSEHYSLAFITIRTVIANDDGSYTITVPAPAALVNTVSPEVTEIGRVATCTPCDARLQLRRSAHAGACRVRGRDHVRGNLWSCSRRRQRSELPKRVREMFMRDVASMAASRATAAEAALRDHCDVAGPTMKPGTVLCLHGLEASRDKTNSWNFGVSKLRQAGHTSIAASRAAQVFVPLIGHWRPLSRITYDSQPVCRWSKENTQRNKDETSEAALLVLQDAINLIFSRFHCHRSAIGLDAGFDLAGAKRDLPQQPERRNSFGEPLSSASA